MRKDPAVRLLTRSDFDGLVCAVLLVDRGVVDDFLFVHPNDLQNGRVEVGADDVLANVPFVPGCGLWFDHHSSENERLELMEKHDFKGSSVVTRSCARVIYDYYGGAKHFARYDANGLMDAVDRSDSGLLSLEDILHPQGWILLSYVMDPRTGFGLHKDYKISNYDLMFEMIRYCRTMDAEEILAVPDVRERITRYVAQERAYERMILEKGELADGVLVINLLDIDKPLVGNRFKEYALFPDAEISLRILWGRKKQNVVFTCGHSILKRTSQVNVGQLMLRYGGGGHTRVGTCQVPTDQWRRVEAELMEELLKKPLEV